MANSQVILKEKIDGLGAEADVVKVKAGYARNFLIPQGKAYEATKSNLRHVENLKASRAGQLMMWGVGWSAPQLRAPGTPGSVSATTDAARSALACERAVAPVRQMPENSAFPQRANPHAHTPYQ